MISILRPLVALFFLPLPFAFAEVPGGSESPTEANSRRVVPVVNATGTLPAEIEGKSVLDSEAIARLPKGNGSLNDVLKVLPGVQFGEGASSSMAAGEILPPNFSISGGKIYENTFLVDGIAADSLLDPLSATPTSIENVPGHPQSIYLHADLIENLAVYRSNISARYGRFTGGVVEATTRSSADSPGLRLSYRTTRHQWTKFHLHEGGGADFENSRSESAQPRFRKEEFRQSLDLPLSNKAALLIHHSHLLSRIPLSHLGGEEEQERSLRNLFAKLQWEPSLQTGVTFSALWTPYEGDYFLKDTRHSRYTISGGGVGGGAALKHLVASGLLEVEGSFVRSENSRKAPADYFIWQNSPSATWGESVGDLRFSREGGSGDLEKEQDTLLLQGHFTSAPVRTGAMSHRLGAGVAYEKSTATVVRPGTSTRYTNASVNNQVVCEAGDSACLAGEQFMIFKNVYEADAVKAHIDFYDGYFEDAVTLGRLTVRPGIRVSYNDLMENTDVAHRLAAVYDLFDNGATALSAGVNRYHGKTFLTHALAERRKPYSAWSRPAALDEAGRPQPWRRNPRSVVNAVRWADLKTPYSDEFTAGIDQAFLGGRLELLYIDRKGREELTTRVLGRDPDGFIFSEWSNEGKSRHKESTVAWEGHLRRSHLLLNVTWKQTRTSHLSYNERFEGDDAVDPVWYKGELLERSRFPAADNNRTWTGNAVYRLDLPYGISCTNVVRYRSGYRVLKDTREDITLPDGRVLDIYEEVKSPESWIFDWVLAWRPPLGFATAVELRMEVLNAFNKKAPVGVGTAGYELGRQVWVGADLRF